MIEVEDLHKRYRHVKAVDGLSFIAKPGEVTGFLGPNGAGKTTTISMILGLAQPDGGEARIGGKPFRELDSPATTVGAVLAGGAFHDRRPARASLHATAAAAGPKSRIPEVLEAVGLADAPNRHVGAYSLGMRQRLSLAQALLGDPDVLILDEPGNGLDPAGLKWLRDTLRGLAHDRGKTVMLSSHILSEVQETVDVAVVIAEGALMSEFSLADADAGFSALGVMTGTLARSPALGVGIALGVLVAIDPLLGSFSFYSEYSLSGASQTLLDPDNRQSHQPLFGSAIALLALYAVVLTAVTLTIERERDVSA